MSKPRRILGIAGGFAIVFGVLTVFSGGRTLLGFADMGAAVPFVLWFNTLAGVAYVVAGLGLRQGRRWAFPFSFAIFAATLLVFAGFGLHVARGGAYEMRTVSAMALRIVVWGGIALLARRRDDQTAGPASDRSTGQSGTAAPVHLAAVALRTASIRRRSEILARTSAR